MTTANTSAAAETAQKAAEQAQRTSRDAADRMLKGAVGAVEALVEVAEKGAWKMLLALGTLMWLVPLALEVRLYGDGLATLSTAKFVTAFVAGAFALAIGASLRLFALREMSHTQIATSVAIKDVAQDAIDAMKDTTSQTLKELTKG
jgi:hypothetical protein